MRRILLYSGWLNSSVDSITYGGVMLTVYENLYLNLSVYYVFGIFETILGENFTLLASAGWGLPRTTYCQELCIILIDVTVSIDRPCVPEAQK